MRSKKILISIVLFTLFSLAARSQTMEIGLNAGATGYMGDLNQKNPLDFSGLALGGYVKANLDPYWAVGLHYNYGRIKDNDLSSSNADFRNRGLNFSTALNELSLQVDFNFLDYFAGGGTKRFTPYIFTGIGGLIFSPKATYGDDEYSLRFYKTENVTYKNYAVSIPYGVGMKYRIGNRLGLFTQLGYRTAFSDYLDDVSGKYPAAPVMAGAVNLSDPSENAIPGSQRGDHVKKDTYLFFHVGISYTFLSDDCFIF